MFFCGFNGTKFLLKTWKLLKKSMFPLLREYISSVLINEQRHVEKKNWKVKSWKSRSRKIENFSCFLVFWTVRKFVLRHENLCKKKMFLLLRKHFSSVLSNEFRNVEKKKKVNSCKPKKSRFVNFSCFLCFVRYKIFT